MDKGKATMDHLNRMAWLPALSVLLVCGGILTAWAEEDPEENPFLPPPVVGPVPTPAQDNPAEWGEEHYKLGRYREAAEFFRKAVAATPAGSPQRAAAIARLAPVLRITGDYQEAIKLLDDALQANPKDTKLALLRAETLPEVGRYEDSLKAFDALIESDANHHRAWALRKQVALVLGKRDVVKKTADHFFDLFNKKSEAFYSFKVPDMLEAAYVGLGIWEEAPKDAFKNGFGLAEDWVEKQHVRTPEVFLWAAQLAFEKYHFNFALARYNKAAKLQPRLPDALAGGAKVMLVSPMRRGDPTEQVHAILKQVFEINPNHVGAHLTEATICLREDRHEDAKKHIDAALAVNPRHIEALAMLAFYHHDRKELDKEAEAEKRALAINPKAADFYCVVGELIESKRNFVDAPQFYRKAVEADPDHWRGYYDLGMNTSRQGALGEEEGRKLLLKAFKMNGFNVWAKNMIVALDKLLGDESQGIGPHYAATKTAHFNLKFHNREAEVVKPYAEEFSEAAYQRQKALFGFEPQGPLTIEVCFTFDDQSARTVGVPNLGALGVCFGKLCTLVSPREGKEGGLHPPFNWRRVLEHEFAHVMTLQQTAFRIPRWFTEGWSTYVEDDSRLQSDQMMVDALARREVKPVEKMEDYFRGNMLMAYVHGRYVVQYLHEKYGMEAHRKAFKMFAEGKKIEEVFPEITGKTLAEINAEQLQYVKDVFKKVRLRPTPDQAELAKVEAAAMSPDASAQAIVDLAWVHLRQRKVKLAEAGAQKALAKDPNCADALTLLGLLDYQKKDYNAAKQKFEASIKADPERSFSSWHHLGIIYKKEGRTSKAIEALEKARAMYPRCSALPDSPYHLLPELYTDLEPPQNEKALKTWQTACEANTGDLVAPKEGLKLAMELKDWQAAARFATTYIEINPYDVQIHRKAGRAYEQLKDWPRAAREFRVATALDEKDVDSFVNLAKAELASGNKAEAQKAVAAALEVDGAHEGAKALRKELGN